MVLLPVKFKGVAAAQKGRREQVLGTRLVILSWCYSPLFYTCFYEEVIFFIKHGNRNGMPDRMYPCS